ncbi:glycoside hydrolase superfamily [Fusarium pseudocircinatum]|uniref:Glycoside hydrolase superfamily n=1 Tax=Fusarium pseudocircinatum TaxID=56676 RepID=A0A8H5UXK0_9HYPO|nr:glycoside hydrolase superfamily [Fusarium pseudocircinatum]
MVYVLFLASLGLGSSVLAAPNYAVLDAQLKNAVAIDPAPVGAFFEFFMWPSYMTNISLNLPCIDRFNELYNRKMPIRIGGTTQDRATYDPDLKGYVSYSVNDPLDAPMSLTYGLKFFDLIKKFGSETILGFNRGLNNRINTFAAVLKAKEKVANVLEILAIPSSRSALNETQEGNNAADWAQDFVIHWKSPFPILAGGGYAIPFEIEPDWPNLPYLIESSYNKTVKDATKVYNGHLYAISNATADDLGPEMTHQRVVRDLNLLPITSAKAAGRPYILDETGFHGLDYEMDSTFGSAIQTTDKTLWALTLGIQRLFYHQGTINQAGRDSIVASVDGTDPYAQYIVYKNGKVFKVVLINTDYYSGDGTRSEIKFTLTGLKSNSVTALRMTGPSSETTVPVSQTDSSPQPSIGGQSFLNKNCELGGKQKTEMLSVKKGKLEVTLKASEALILFL